MPNPAEASVTIAYTVPEGCYSANLSVHDVAGRLVRQLGITADGVGFGAVDWDGQAGSGSRAASGVYFVRLDVNGSVATRSFVLLR